MFTSRHDCSVKVHQAGGADDVTSLGLSQPLPDEMFHGGRLGGLRAVLRFELAPDGFDPPPSLEETRSPSPS